MNRLEKAYSEKAELDTLIDKCRQWQDGYIRIFSTNEMMRLINLLVNSREELSKELDELREELSGEKAAAESLQMDVYDLMDPEGQ